VLNKKYYGRGAPMVIKEGFSKERML
jgi:hypothetical protein